MIAQILEDRGFQLKSKTDSEYCSPCPFCGGNNLDFITNVDGERLTGKEYIVCNDDNCLAEGSIADNKEEALEKWNKRF